MPKTRNSLTGSQVLARMRRGDLPTLKGGYSYKAVFEDGTVVSHLVMRRLVRTGLVKYPVGTSISSPFTLISVAR